MIKRFQIPRRGEGDMKQKDSRSILTAPLLLFAATVLAVFFVSKFIETGRYYWLIPFALSLFFLFGALIAVISYFIQYRANFFFIRKVI